MIPSPWPALILALGVFRLVRLVGWDDISATPRAWLTGLTDREYNDWAKWVWEQQQQDLDPWRDGKTVVPVGPVRFKLAQLVRCPWCAGFWVSLASYLAWYAAGYATMTVATPLALSAVVGLVAKHLDK